MKNRAPIAKLAAAMLLPVMLLFSLNPVVPAIVLAGELVAVPFFGLRYRDLARRAWPLGVAAVAMMVTYTLFAADFTVGRGVALALRLLAIALPGVIVFLTTDPTDLADSLIQHGHASPRFAIGALASFRLVGTLRQEWDQIRMARRARGLRSAFARSVFVLLVGAIRRGVRLSVAMDARGFDSRIKRTVARPQSFTYKDVALILGAVALGALALIAGQRDWV